jgi:glucosamine--fructose-6-phosphate aminotransferase (isomerizing)
VCLNLIALWFSKLHGGSASKRTRVIKDLNQLSYDFENTLKHLDNEIKSIAKDFSKYKNVFILGKECDEAVAREGALKIKEISYIHAEGCSATALKHGPFALLDENMPVILMDNEHFQSKITNTFEEVSSRHSPIYFVSSNSAMESKATVLKVSKNATFQSLLNIIPLQLLAYYASIEKGINPDTPKNLAKVVTVE